MGLFFDDVPKIAKSKKQLQKAVRQQKTLNYKEKPEVLDSLTHELDDGGLTERELKKSVKDLRHSHKISELDAKKLLDLGK